MDFILYGNAFSGNSEPGAVEVSQDKNNDGIPDKWYQIANSEYFENSTIHDYEVTYQNPDTTFSKRMDVPWSDNLGASGTIISSSYHDHAYYPNPANYDDVDENSMTFSGTKLTATDVAFGCADVHENGTIDNIAANPYVEAPNKGDGIDIAWAVDENNEPINLDEISFVKVYNAVQMSNAFGEVGPEISYITRAKSADTEVGKTEDVSSITVGGKTVALTAGVYSYDVDELSDSFDVSVNTSSDNVFINNERASTLGVSYGNNTEKTVRIIAQDGEKLPVTYFLHIHKKVTSEKTLTVRVEGIHKNILYDKNFTVKTDGDKNITALDALEQALNAAGISYMAKDGYISSINGDSAGSFGGYDGWMYAVNDSSPSVGMGSYEIKDKDNLVVYYGDMNTAYPLITTNQTHDAITLTCRYNGYDENFNPTNLPLAGATLTLGANTYTSDDNGQVTIPITDAMRGESLTLGVTKTAENGLPLVVRLSSDDKIAVSAEDEKTLTIRVEGIGQNILYDKSFTAKSDSEGKLTALDALEQALNSANIAYTVSGGYITSINGETAGSFGGWDGWLYEVNDTSPSVGMSDYKVENKDNLVIFYGDTSTAYPLITSSQTRDALSLTFRYDGYDENWNPVNLPLCGATVTLNGNTYTTDENGKITIPITDDMRGRSFAFSISKTAANGLPLAVRLASDKAVTIAKVDKLSADNAAISVDNTPLYVDVPSNVNGTLKLSALTVGDQKSTLLPKIEAKKVSGDSSIDVNIEDNTTCTGSSSWDGNILLPALTANPMITGVTVASAVKIGADVDLSFDKPVRLFVPNVSGKSVGYINQSGTFKEITNVLASDSADALGMSQEGYIKLDNGIAIWTKHFTTFAFYSKNSTDSGSGSGGGSTSSSITVSVKVTGDSKKGTILPVTRVTVSKGTSAWSAIEEALDDAGIDYEYSSGYISSIGGLSEFDDGANSGWMYTVNGTEPTKSANQYTLADGDAVVVKYVTSYAGGSGSSSSSSANAGISNTSAKGDTTDLTTVLKSIQSRGGLSTWEMFDLALNGYTVDDKSLKSFEDEYQSKEGSYRLVTDYAKLVVALKAMGKPMDEFAGYPLLSQIYNNSNLGKQGSNGYIYSLMALYGVSLPSDTVWTQDKIIDKILTYQKADGGFSLTETGASDLDVTAMAISALAPYKDQNAVKTSIDKAISYLKNAQGSDGFFAYNGEKTSETVSQVIIALSSMGMDAASSEFTKNKKTLIDILKSYELSDHTFSHTAGGSSDLIATEQAVLALTAYNRYVQGKAGVYELSPSTSSSKMFSDVNENDWYYDAVNFAAEKGITSGVGNHEFAPNAAVTRGQFVKMLCDAYGIAPTTSGENFEDGGNTWYTPYLAAVKQRGISEGVGNNLFAPEKEITREEMFTLLYNVLKSLDKLPKGSGKELDCFNDASSVSSWANEAVSYMVLNGVVNGNGGAINPKSGATRAELAQVFYGLLAK